MKKEDIVSNLEKIDLRLKQFKNMLKKIETLHTSKKEILDEAKVISTMWFETYSHLDKYSIEKSTIEKYSNNFKKLFSLSSGSQRLSTYLKLVDIILKDLKKSILVPIMTSNPIDAEIEPLNEILKIVSPEEAEYLKEAQKCASVECYRSCIILGWCAVAHRMHKKIEKMGFQKFNESTVKMCGIVKGRYSKFNREYNIQSFAELQTIPDGILLQVLEFSGFIDAQQYKTLETCLEIRNNSGHPGKVVIKKLNLESFFSDLKVHVFDNPQFSAY